MSFGWLKKDGSGKRRLRPARAEAGAVLVTLGILLGLAAAGFAGSARGGDDGGVYAIDGRDLEGFEACRIGAGPREAAARLIREGRAVRREKNAVVFAIRGEVLGLPAREIAFGLCDDGSQDCGWGAYVAVTVAVPFPQAREALEARTGIDFAQELRDEEAEATLRPVLAPAGNAHESVLSCDPGNL